MSDPLTLLLRAEYAELSVEKMLEQLRQCAIAEDRVREIHRPDCGAETRFCRCCMMAYPCPTIRALGGKP